ncbi:MAG: hypothetical protein JSR39_06395 [Verrucomicrobia bacterium]|nr:hypothetical protein [Verrucomicrobiota bacterium]
MSIGNLPVFTIYSSGTHTAPSIIDNDGSEVTLEEAARRIYRSFQDRMQRQERLFPSSSIGTSSDGSPRTLDEMHPLEDETLEIGIPHLDEPGDDEAIDPFELLPPEMIAHILSHCSFEENVPALSVNVVFHQILERILVNEVSEFVKKDKHFADRTFHTIEDLAVVKQLKINFADLSEVPSSIALLRNLVSIELIGNKITALPSSMAKLRKLAHMNLDHNSISTVPTVLSKMPRTEVHLHANQLTNLEARKCRALPRVRL